MEDIPTFFSFKTEFHRDHKNKKICDYFVGHILKQTSDIISPQLLNNSVSISIKI